MASTKLNGVIWVYQVLSVQAMYMMAAVGILLLFAHSSRRVQAPTWVSSLRSRLLLRSPALTVRKMALPLGALFAWKVLSLMSPCGDHSGFRISGVSKHRRPCPQVQRLP